MQSDFSTLSTSSFAASAAAASAASRAFAAFAAFTAFTAFVAVRGKSHSFILYPFLRILSLYLGVFVVSYWLTLISISSLNIVACIV